MITKLISPEECYPLRSKVLRNGKPFDFCKFSEDHDPHAIHVGAVKDNAIISVASFLPVSLNSKPFKNQFQLRGMATHPDHRRISAGSKLIRFAEQELKKRNADFIWFNAREKAFVFYERLGYQELDGIVTVSEYGPHKIMWKAL